MIPIGSRPRLTSKSSLARCAAQLAALWAVQRAVQLVVQQALQVYIL